MGRLVIRRDFEQMPSIAYWVIIGVAAVVFGALHFPATIMLFGELTPMLTFRGFLLNGIGGMVFGYLFWKYGIEYAILCHMMTHMGMQLVFIPLFF